MDRVLQVNTSKSTPPRNCYCGLWEKDAAFLEARHIPRGFCGICERCGQPGHLRHAPGGASYTGAWCDGCYRITAIRNNARMLFVIGAIVAAIFAVRTLVKWLGA